MNLKEFVLAQLNQAKELHQEARDLIGDDINDKMTDRDRAFMLLGAYIAIVEVSTIIATSVPNSQHEDINKFGPEVSSTKH